MELNSDVQASEEKAEESETMLANGHISYFQAYSDTKYFSLSLVFMQLKVLVGSIVVGFKRGYFQDEIQGLKEVISCLVLVTLLQLYPTLAPCIQSH